MKSYYLLLVPLLLTGCKSEFVNMFQDKNGDKGKQTTYTRQVLDSAYLYDALICSDKDEDYTCSESEGEKETNTTGQASVVDGEKPTIATFVVSKTVSSDPYHAATDNYQMIGFPKTKYVTPFTTYAFLSKRSFKEIELSLGLKEHDLDDNYMGSGESATFAKALARSFVLRFNSGGIKYYIDNPQAVKALGADLKLIAQKLHESIKAGDDLNTVVINL